MNIIMTLSMSTCMKMGKGLHEHEHDSNYQHEHETGKVNKGINKNTSLRIRSTRLKFSLVWSGLIDQLKVGWLTGQNIAYVGLFKHSVFVCVFVVVFK